MSTMDKVTKVAKTVKAGIVALHRQRIDLAPFVEFSRKGRLVATLHALGAPESDDTPLPVRSGGVGALGWATDEVCLVFEAVLAAQGIDDPVPERGELLNRLRDDPFSDVHEALVVVLATRTTTDGANVRCAMLPYEYVEVDGGIAIRWLDDHETRGEGLLTGAVMQMLRRWVSGERSDVREILDALVGIDDGIDQAGLDAFVARFIEREYQHKVLLAP